MSRFEGLNYLVVGCGFYGSVLAERIATVLNERVVIIDRKNHVGGNSYSEVDSETGIEVHKYGSHIFHTRNKRVWDYVNIFTSFNNYQHKVFTQHSNRIYNLPICLMTINTYFGLNLSPSEAEIFVKEEAAKSQITDPKNLEEKAISMLGERLYKAFIKGYTEKQWGRKPHELPQDIINRLPMRTNLNNNYFDDPWQGIPLNGYATLFNNILRNNNIEIQLNTDFMDCREAITENCRVIYTGMIDQLFNYKYGQLDWRGVDFTWQTLPVRDYQGTAVMNFADLDAQYTRIHEYKHYHPERTQIFSSPHTIICKEYSINCNIGEDAFYPVDNERNRTIYELYIKEASKNRNLILGGRLGSYKYWDMDKTIENALLCFEHHLS